MPDTACSGKFWAMIIDGKAVELGRDSYQMNDFPDLVFYDDEDVFNADPLIIAYKKERSDEKSQKELTRFDTTTEYVGKAENATRWRFKNIDAADSIGDYTATEYPWMALEIGRRDITPEQCAQEIYEAMNRESDDMIRAGERIDLRERLKKERKG